MTGREHYQAAEALVEEATDPADHGVENLRAHIALAQVHATLALAAATRPDITRIKDVEAGLGRPRYKEAQ